MRGELFQAGQERFVDVLPRDELPLIETRAIVQEQFDVPRENGCGVQIDRMVQFLFDILKTARNGRCFPLRQMQCLPLAVRKERVVFDMIFQ